MPLHVLTYAVAVSLYWGVTPTLIGPASNHLGNLGSQGHAPLQVVYIDFMELDEGPAELLPLASHPAQSPPQAVPAQHTPGYPLPIQSWQPRAEVRKWPHMLSSLCLPNAFASAWQPCCVPLQKWLDSRVTQWAHCVSLAPGFSKLAY